jgi:flagellar protein FlaG
MNTLNSHNLDTQVVAINSTPPNKAVADKTTAMSATAKNISKTLINGQQPAVNGNSVPETIAAGEAKEKSLEQAITRINSYVQQVQRDLKFSVDDESGKTVIKVIDSQSKEVIRQIPEEVLLQIAQSIEESLEGSLLEVEA